MADVKILVVGPQRGGKTSIANLVAEVRGDSFESPESYAATEGVRWVFERPRRPAPG